MHRSEPHTSVSTRHVHILGEPTPTGAWVPFSMIVLLGLGVWGGLRKRHARRCLSWVVMGWLCSAAGCDSSSTTPDPELPASEELSSESPTAQPIAAYQPRKDFDTSGFSLIGSGIKTWPPETSLEELSQIWDHPGRRAAGEVEQFLTQPGVPLRESIRAGMARMMFLNYEGEAEQVYTTLGALRTQIEGDPPLAQQWLYSVIYYQGVTALRRGENSNCIMCRGETSCILPITPGAVHQVTEGSRAAIGHFTEYLTQFPDDRHVAWLLNVAHMTLGEHPDKVDPRFLISLDAWSRSAEDIGQFRDVSSHVGLDRFNQSGGGILEDFDNDGLLDVVVTAIDPTQSMGMFRNLGNGQFKDVALTSGVLGQLGGLYCVQTDYNNDGFLDIYVPRGAWFLSPIRPSLLRNEGDGTWTDVTEEAGLMHSVNSNSATWADYDNDGNLDLFVCCERQQNRLFRNRGDGGFDVVPQAGGVTGEFFCKGATWLDYDNDDWPDLFVNYLQGQSQLFHNQRDGQLVDVSAQMGITGPKEGFACWTWDYNNDGWLDIFATSYHRSIPELIDGMLGQHKGPPSSRLWRNREGKQFDDQAKAAGLDAVYETMGCNFGDLDNDGWLDMYLGTGDPEISTLVPNRMFRNSGGQRFVEISGSSRTGHLQKGHSVGFGDWDRNGDLDLFVQMGGAINGDKFHNVLFQNPGHTGHQITVRLIGRGCNRAALGVRLKVQLGGAEPRTIYRHITSGSSFGANTLEASIGLRDSEFIEQLEVHWPATGKTQQLTVIPMDQLISIVEGTEGYFVLPTVPIPLPALNPAAPVAAVANTRGAGLP